MVVVRSALNCKAKSFMEYYVSMLILRGALMEFTESLFSFIREFLAKQLKKAMATCNIEVKTNLFNDFFCKKFIDLIILRETLV